MVHPEYLGANISVLNPKAITVNETYGFSDPISKEWTEGVLAHTFKNVSRNYSRREWIVCDGPVDAD